MGRKIDTKDIRPGDVWSDAFGAVRVMAVAEGYVMYRRRGRAPSIEHHILFRRVHRRLPTVAEMRGILADPPLSDDCSR